MYAFFVALSVASASPAPAQSEDAPVVQAPATAVAKASSADAAHGDKQKAVRLPGVVRLAQDTGYDDPYGDGGSSGADPYGDPPASTDRAPDGDNYRAPPPDPAPSGRGTYDQGLSDGTNAGANESAALWGVLSFGSTCVFGIFGCLGTTLIGYAVDPTVRFQSNRSQAYNEGYSKGFGEEVKSSRMSAALIGGGASLVITAGLTMAYFVISFGTFFLIEDGLLFAVSPAQAPGPLGAPPPILSQLMQLPQMSGRFNE